MQAEWHIGAEINRRLCLVYGDNIMSDGSVRDCCTKFRDGLICVALGGGNENNTHSIVIDELFQKFGHVVREKTLVSPFSDLF